MAKPVTRGEGGGLSVCGWPLRESGGRKRLGDPLSGLEQNAEGGACCGPRASGVDLQLVDGCCGAAQE